MGCPYRTTSLLKAAARFLMIVALMISIGAHWGVLQVAAWANMINVYSEEKGLWEGLKDTFDGEHPCEMCKKLGAEKKEEQQKAPLSKDAYGKSVAWLPVEDAAFLQPPSWRGAGTIHHSGGRTFHPTAWDLCPPVPPPERGA
jgi:hypothetical protein